MKMTGWKRGWTLGALVLVAGSVLAGVATAQAVPSNADAGRMVERYFNGLTTLQANFTQQATGDAYVQEGTFSLKKPRKFLWQYETPSRQKVVSTGAATYYVDQERNQVTQLPNSAGIARFFNTSGFTLAKVGAQVENVATKGSDLVVTLKLDGKVLKDDQAGLERVTMTFNRQPMVLKRVEALDTMNTNTVVTFSNVRTGIALSDKLFAYTPPRAQQAD